MLKMIGLWRALDLARELWRLRMLHLRPRRRDNRAFIVCFRRLILSEKSIETHLLDSFSIY